jgi:hypothetical protein
MMDVSVLGKTPYRQRLAISAQFGSAKATRGEATLPNGANGPATPLSAHSQLGRQMMTHNVLLIVLFKMSRQGQELLVFGFLGSWL